MNTAIPNQTTTAANQHLSISEVKVCNGCSSEFYPPENSRRTSFGLILCDDCLYS